MTSTAERDAWIILASTDRVGGETVAALLADFGSAREALAAARRGELARWSAARRGATDGRRPLAAAVLEALRESDQSGAARLRRIAELGLWPVTPLDEDYPAGLRDLDPPPPLLIGSGQRSLLGARRAVAVVGTRRPTAHGRWLTARICVRLVECGALVVSGLAVGIDGAAHAATLDRGGATLAVIGGGHLHPGPRAHEALRRRITAERGAILSEYAPSVMPTKGTYPRRNRIIAALAAATIVVEAPARSGALITAHHALALGRPVLAAPGRVGEWSVAGSLELLRTTPARVLTGIDAMSDDLDLLPRPPADRRADGAGRSTLGNRTAALGLLGGAQRLVAERICRSPAGLDVLVDDTGLEPSVVSGAVTMLMLRGWIQPLGPAYLPAGALLE